MGYCQGLEGRQVRAAGHGLLPGSGGQAGEGRGSWVTARVWRAGR